MSNANFISMTCSSQQNISFPHFIVVTFDSCYVQGGRLIEVKITKRKDKHNTATGRVGHLTVQVTNTAPV